MKRVLQVASLWLISPVIALSQVPNAGFENWTNGQPDGWFTNNIPGLAVPVTQSSTPKSGASALQGTVVTFQGVGSYPPIVQSFFPVSQRYATLSGFYQFAPLGGDSLVVFVFMYNTSALSFIGAGVFIGTPTGSSYQSFSAPITYINSNIPDSCYIQIFISGEDSVHLGSTMLFDDLSLSGIATAVTETPAKPLTFSLEQNYPNPFNPVTNIEFTISAPRYTSLVVYDMLGREVAALVDGMKQPGTYTVQWDAHGFASGVYMYRLQSGDFIATKKLVMLQ